MNMAAAQPTPKLSVIAPTAGALERVQTTLHGHLINLTIAGKGPPVVLIHGVAGRASQWDEIAIRLAANHLVIAPDLLGHGESAKPRGDYSLGAHASGIRDLLVGLGVQRASIVGHSLGGGIAMQFAYQYPELCERLVLVNSGGLGDEVHGLLRAATLPGSEFVLPVIAHPRVVRAAGILPRALGLARVRTRPDLVEMARGYQALANAEARNAFIHTLRAVIDPTGQRINATDRLYLASAMPSLIIWGCRDRIIPVAHGRAAHGQMPGSRLELFERAGHFPFLDDPDGFTRVLERFFAETEPAQLTSSMMRERVLEHDAASRELLERLQREHPAA
jgi:pimeloyl-ACP methyl ester carboxylesterase